MLGLVLVATKACMRWIGGLWTNRDARMRKEHPKKQRSGTVVAKANCRKWKKDSASCPVLTAVAKSRSDRMKSMYGKKRGYKKFVRTLVEVPVDWSC